MRFVVLIYNDGAMLDAMPPAEFDETMRGCLAHADELRREGRLLDSSMLEEPSRARSIRVRNGRRTVVDGPFAETKEFLGGFNLIEADSMDEALEIAMRFPWASSGCVEVRPVRDIEVVRARVTRTAAAAG
jgi:hypothetical protein